MFNEKLNGISLEGIIQAVQGEQVKINLNIDGKDGVAWFRYASITGDILYSMPLDNEYALLYFSNEYEEPVVTSCVRKNGNICDKFKNVNKRYYVTESGNNLEIFPDSINVYRKQLSIKLNDIKGIEIKSSGIISVVAKNRVHMLAKRLNVNAQSRIVVQKNHVSVMTLEGDLNTQTIGVVRENGRY